MDLVVNNTLNSSRSRDFFDPLFFVLLFLMIVFSTVLMPAKIVLAVLLFAVVLIRIFLHFEKFDVSTAVIAWFLIYVSNNILEISVALANGSSHALDSINVQLIEPVIFAVFVVYMKEDKYNFFFNSLKICLGAACLYNILFAMSLNGFLPGVSSDFFIGNYPNLGGLSIGFTKIHSNNLSWVMFLFPAVFSSIFLKDTRLSKTDYAIIAMGILNAVLSLRTAFLLGVALTPVLIVIFGMLGRVRYDQKRIVAFLAFSLFLLLVMIILKYDMVISVISGLVEKIMLSFSFGSTNAVDSGGSIRMEQIRDLLDTWAERPLLGWGANANARNVIRSDVAGAYEMQYFAMLMQKGLVGFSVFIMLIGWIYVKAVEIIKSHTRYSMVMFSTIIGYTIFLIANATNPYLGSFDRLFILFIPLILINDYSLGQKGKNTIEQ